MTFEFVQTFPRTADETDSRQKTTVLDIQYTLWAQVRRAQSAIYSALQYRLNEHVLVATEDLSCRLGRVGQGL